MPRMRRCMRPGPFPHRIARVPSFATDAANRQPGAASAPFAAGRAAQSAHCRQRQQKVPEAIRLRRPFLLAPWGCMKPGCCSPTPFILLSADRFRLLPHLIFDRSTVSSQSEIRPAERHTLSSLSGDSIPTASARSTKCFVPPSLTNFRYLSHAPDGFSH